MKIMDFIPKTTMIARFVNECAAAIRIVEVSNAAETLHIAVGGKLENAKLKWKRSSIIDITLLALCQVQIG